MKNCFFYNCYFFKHLDCVVGSNKKVIRETIWKIQIYTKIVNYKGKWIILKNLLNSWGFHNLHNIKIILLSCQAVVILSVTITTEQQKFEVIFIRGGQILQLWSEHLMSNFMENYYDLIAWKDDFNILKNYMLYYRKRRFPFYNFCKIFKLQENLKGNFQWFCSTHYIITNKFISLFTNILTKILRTKCITLFVDTDSWKCSIRYIILSTCLWLYRTILQIPLKNVC